MIARTFDTPKAPSKNKSPTVGTSTTKGEADSGSTLQLSHYARPMSLVLLNTTWCSGFYATVLGSLKESPAPF
jgi:hypothetical protein